MVEKKVTVKNKTGLHARPAALFVKKAMEFSSNIWIQKDDKKVDAKSMLSVLSLGVSIGTEIVLSAEGEDEQKAVDSLVDLIENKLKE